MKEFVHIINSIQKSRNSNIEGLRILAMLMILILHVDFFTIGEPTTVLAVEKPLSTFTSIFFEMFALISVNLFVMISGWFSIRFNYKSLLKLVFQCVFIISLMYCIGIAIDQAVLNTAGVLECFFMTNNAWFVKSYIGLFILAPVLNAFLEGASKRIQETVLVSFYLFQTFYGCLYHSENFFGFGYSAFSFIGLYLLAGYIRKYYKNLCKYGLYLWAISLSISVLWYYIPLRCDMIYVSNMTFHYTSPTVILGALGLLSWVTTLPPRHNRVINYIAASCFSVYLYHICNTWTSQSFKDLSLFIYNQYSGVIYLIIITAFIVSVFMGGILIDQIRKLCWWRLEIHLKQLQ